MKPDFREIQADGKIHIKLTKDNISQLNNGKILEGFKSRIGLEASNE